MIRRHEHTYLARHVKYIDYRLRLINDYVSSDESASPGIIRECVIFLIRVDTDRVLNPLPGEAGTALREIRDLVYGWNIFEDGDILGYIYQNIQLKTDKKKKGQFFTPPDIAEYLMKESLEHITPRGMKILDPACGSGLFLIIAYRHIVERYKARGMDSRSAGVKAVKENLFGFDIDPLSVEIAKKNLSQISGCSPDDVNIRAADFLSKNPGLFHRHGDERCDVIVGNPPWRSRFSENEKKYYRTRYCSAQSGLNTFTLFIERSFDFIRDGGVITYLVPGALLNIKAHRSARRFILQNAEIKNFTEWGERFKNVFAPSVSILLKQQADESCRNKNIVHIRNGGRMRDVTSVLVPQASYGGTHENIFNINYSRKAVNIISAMEEQDCFYLKDRAKFFLGIVTGNNAKYLSTARSDEFPDPIIIGRDLARYRIDFSSHYFKYDAENLQQAAPRSLYTSRDKLFYKFIGRTLTFAVDRSGFYSLNNVNGFIPQFNDINIESALAVLNSGLMQYFYEKNFFTIKVLRGNLEKLPIKIIRKRNQARLKNLVDGIIDSGGCGDAGSENIEDIVFFEYGLKDRQAYFITDYLHGHAIPTHSGPGVSQLRLHH